MNLKDKKLKNEKFPTEKDDYTIFLESQLEKISSGLLKIDIFCDKIEDMETKYQELNEKLGNTSNFFQEFIGEQVLNCIIFSNFKQRQDIDILQEKIDNLNQNMDYLNQDNSNKISSIEEKIVNYIDISKLEDLIQKVAQHEFEDKLKLNENKIIVKFYIS